MLNLACCGGVRGGLVFDKIAAMGLSVSEDLSIVVLVKMEHQEGIEPSSVRWQRTALPLSY